MTIGQRIRNTRIEQNISQESLAELADVSRQTVSKWENGAAYPSGENLTALSRIFHIPMDALVKDDWVPPEEKPPEVQYVEIPVEVPVEVKVEVPVPRPRNYRLWALLAAVILAAGILMGALFFREQHENLVHDSELECEVIDDILALQLIPKSDSWRFLPGLVVLSTPEYVLHFFEVQSLFRSNFVAVLPLQF